MNEFERQWSELLKNATKLAAETGRDDIAEYLSLRANNDTIRKTGIEWIFDTLSGLVSKADQNGYLLKVEREDPYSFKLGNSNLTGSVLRIRQGVRCLSVEAGWTRAPGDGIMRGGSLAAAKIRHFGIPKASMDIYLVRSDDTYIWNFQTRDDLRGYFGSEHLAAHFQLFSESGIL